MKYNDYVHNYWVVFDLCDYVLVQEKELEKVEQYFIEHDVPFWVEKKHDGIFKVQKL